MKLIDEWKIAWKYFSVQANTIGLAISGAYGAMYDQLKDAISPGYMALITAFVFMIGIIGRITSQGLDKK